MSAPYYPDEPGPVDVPVPYDQRAEESLIGALLLDRDRIVYVAPYVRAEDFYFERMRWAYEAITALYEQTPRTPTDLTTLAEALSRKGRLEAFGGHAAIVALVNRTPTAAHAEYYARIVQRLAVMRRLISVGGEIAALGYKREENPDTVVADAYRRLGLVMRNAGKPIATGEKMAESLRERLEVRNLPGVPTGYTQFDELTGGLHLGEVVTWAARPGRAKTSVGLNIALNAVQYPCPWAQEAEVEQGPGPRNFRALILSFEMPRERLEDRFASMLSGVNVADLRKGRVFNSADRARVEDAANRLSELGLYVEDTAGLDILGVTRKIAEAKALYDVDLVVIDYLQLIRGSNQKRDDLRQQIVEVTNKLKRAAKDDNVAIFQLAQLSRETEKRPLGEPEIQDLKESGSIEEDSDVVVLAWRPELAKPERDNRGMLAAKLGKNRNGPFGVMFYHFNPETQRVVEWADRPADTYAYPHAHPSPNGHHSGLPHGRPEYVVPSPSRPPQQQDDDDDDEMEDLLL